MTRPSYRFLFGLCCVTSSACFASDLSADCDNGALYYGLAGKGETTAVEVIQPLPPLGEQLGEFEVVLVRADYNACGQHHKRCFKKESAHGRGLFRWKGVVRGRQTLEEGMHHALANVNGYGLILTTDFADPTPLGECDVYGVPGLLIRETLVVDEGSWDGQRVSGQFVVNVCLPVPEYLEAGSKIQFKVVKGTDTDGTKVCLTPEPTTE